MKNFSIHTHTAYSPLGLSVFATKAVSFIASSALFRGVNWSWRPNHKTEAGFSLILQKLEQKSFSLYCKVIKLVLKCLFRCLQMTFQDPQNATDKEEQRGAAQVPTCRVLYVAYRRGKRVSELCDAFNRGPFPLWAASSSYIIPCPAVIVNSDSFHWYNLLKVKNNLKSKNKMYALPIARAIKTKAMSDQLKKKY